MTFETELRERLRESAGGVTASDDLLDRAERRHAVHIRNVRAVTGGAAVAVLALVVALGLAVLDRLPQAPVPAITGGETPRERATEGPRGPEPSASVPPAAGSAGWSPMAPSPAEGGGWSVRHAVWAGDRLLVVGGEQEVGGDSSQLLSYDPAADAWSGIDRRPEDEGRWAGTATWTGRELVLLGGYPLQGSSPDVTPEPPTVEGWAYDPSSERWRKVPEAPLAPRWGMSVTWTGDELIVWGGFAPGDHGDDGLSRTRTYADGAAWDPETDRWRTLADSPLASRGLHGAVWNGRRLIVFGGGDTTSYESEFHIERERHDAAVYDPVSDEWATIRSPEEIGPLVAAHWTGEEIVYWTGHLGPQAPGNWLPTGRVWDPVTGASRPLPAPPLDQRRDDVRSAWIGELGAMLVWGGGCGEGCNASFATGALFHPSTDSWTSLTPPEGAVGFGSASAWTGDRLLVVGGSGDAFGVDPSRVAGASWSPADR